MTGPPVVPGPASEENHPPDSPGPGNGTVSPALRRALAAHPTEMAALMQELHRRVVDEATLLDLMGRASREAVRLIEDTRWAGVTAQFAGIPFTAAHTDDTVLIVDEGQYGQGDGPCLTAMRTDTTTAMTGDQVREIWPHLARIADLAGVHSYLASPLHARDRSVGSLNLYSARPEGVRTPHPDVLTVLTEYLDRGLTDYSATQPGEAQALQLQQQLRHRRVIDHAVGILIGQHGLTPTDAADLLDLQAEHLGVPVHRVAADIIGEHTAGRPPKDPPPIR